MNKVPASPAKQDRASREQNPQAVSAVPATIPDAVWVVVRSSGEYSDRIETPIRFCLSEADAQAAVALTAIEAQRDIGERPVYKRRSTHGWQAKDGAWLPEDTGPVDPTIRVREATFRPYPDAEAREAQIEAWRQEYYAACLALGHVDPDGSWSGDEYYYAPVTYWPTDNHPSPPLAAASNP